LPPIGLLKGLWPAFLLALCPLAGHAAPPELKAQGNKLVVKATGVAVRLTGVNTPSLEWGLNGENLNSSIPYAISDWHSKIIRLPVDQAFWLSATNGPAYKARIDGFIALASDAGAYVILDLHEFGQPTANATAFWMDAANRYKNNPAVIFGLFNEPHGITWDVWKNGDANGPGLQPLLTTVRATGANNLVLVGGLDYAYDLSGILNGYALAETATGNGIIYDTHLYPWKGSWQGKVGNVAQIHPVLAGEFGHPGGTTYIGLTFETHTTWVPRALDWVDAHQLHWTGWSFHPTATPNLISDWNFTPTSFWGAPALERLQAYQNPSSDKIAGGTVIGTPGTRALPTSGVITDPAFGAVSAFNGVYSNYFDAATASGGWTGLDLGTAKRITKIRFMPRQNNGNLMVGGIFQASNTANFSSGVANLFTVATAPTATGGVYTAATVANTGAYRYVRYLGPANAYCNVASILFYTGDGMGNTAAGDDVILDNTSVPGVSRIGTWTASTATTGYYGSNYWHDGNIDKGTKSMRYTPNLPAAANYQVFARWTSGTNRATNVPIDLVHSGGTSRVEVNQQANNGQWVSLGVYPFNAGTGGSVQILTAGTNGFVIADAIRFVRQ
jgi:hypothetical protein